MILVFFEIGELMEKYFYGIEKIYIRKDFEKKDFAYVGSFLHVALLLSFFQNKKTDLGNWPFPLSGVQGTGSAKASIYVRFRRFIIFRYVNNYVKHLWGGSNSS